jgi:2-phosphosulfolactate phosphatase
MKRVDVWMTKEEIDPQQLEQASVVVIDVCLATTSMLTMLEQGARRVFPVEDVQEARRLVRILGTGQVKTAGEQHGSAVDGFDFGPYPSEFTKETVQGKDVIYLSTNGTRAIRKALAAKELSIACLRNVSAVARDLQRSTNERAILVCAGSNGHISMEDTMCAGLILSRMQLAGIQLNDAAILAKDFAEARPQHPREWLPNTRVGRWFVREGLGHVLDFVGDLDASQTVARLEDGILQCISNP